MPDPRTMIVSLDSDDDDSELDYLRMQLGEELSLLDVDEIEQLTVGEAPPGARAVDMVAIGALLVKFGPAALKGVIGGVVAWFQRSSANSIELTIDGDTIKLTKTSSKEQDRLLALFEAKHGATKPAS
jgi:hypothetical protein